MGLGPPGRRDATAASSGCRARGPLASIGIDTWAIDYGLLDDHGELVEAPVSYRDKRTAGYREVADRIGERRLYEIAGLQLHADQHDLPARRPRPRRARRGPATS